MDTENNLFFTSRSQYMYFNVFIIWGGGGVYYYGTVH